MTRICVESPLNFLSVGILKESRTAEGWNRDVSIFIKYRLLVSTVSLDLFNIFHSSRVWFSPFIYFLFFSFPFCFYGPWWFPWVFPPFPPFPRFTSRRLFRRPLPWPAFPRFSFPVPACGRFHAWIHPFLPVIFIEPAAILSLSVSLLLPSGLHGIPRNYPRPPRPHFRIPVLFKLIHINKYEYIYFFLGLNCHWSVFC